MKIAIVTPHPVPFALGGAENLWWGLQNHFVTRTDHQCDLVALVSPEASFWDLVGSYEAFSQLDLSAYDCVISGKYPAWMVNHPNHICYMLHRLRGLYDTYSGPVEQASGAQEPEIRRLLQWMSESSDGGANPDPDQIPALFERLRRLQAADLPENAFAFPGPLSRAVVHYLDDAALSSGRIRRYAAISETVRRRRGYFPGDAVVEVLYPPPHRDDYREGDFGYFFTSSRLDSPKRVNLIVDAMRHVEGDIQLRIAGTGPQEASLRTLAANDSRVHFLGYVPDDALPQLYAGAIAVPFVPFDEDYGLVAIEAMRSGKPVVTVEDAGGAREFVEDGATGYVTAATAEALGARLQQLAQDRDLARKLGAAARERVAAVTWQAVADGLLAAAAPPVLSATSPRRPKLTVATTFPVYPPMNGGQARVFHLYRNLARYFDIDIVSLGETTRPQSERQIAPGLIEIAVPKSQAHEDVENEMAGLVGRIPIGDIAADAVAGLTPDLHAALELSALTSDAVIACHPYLARALRQAAPDKAFWYEAQDVEATLKAAVFAGMPAAAPLMEIVHQTEKASWLSSEHVFACTQRDLESLATIYGPTRAHLHEVPNGVALDEISFVAPAARRTIQERIGLRDQMLAMFMGSWHGPNIDAVEQIVGQASQSPHVLFAIIGSVCRPFADRQMPANVQLLGLVDSDTRNDLLAVADVALNPMRAGSGTNLKMLDYFAAGIPVISSSFGARGLLSRPGQHFVLAEDGELGGAVEHLAAMREQEMARMVHEARELVETHYAWDVVADRFCASLVGAGFTLPSWSATAGGAGHSS